MMHQRLPQRSGVVLITVLIVLAVLLLVGYQYLNLMNAESNAAVVSGRVTQSRYLADSGVHYASFLLAYPQTQGVSDGTDTDSYRVWPGSVYDNSDLFHARPVNGPSGVKGYFSIVSRRDPASDQQASSIGYRFGVEDENGKISLNAIRQLIRKDSSMESKIKTILLAIPNIDEDKANAVINWSKEGGTPDPGEASYYSSLGYQAKGGPYDTLDEMLLVKGWTPKLLYGNDKNRNGRLDPDEDDGSGAVDLGFQKYFTVYSRELNVDSTGQQRINLMSSDLVDLKTKLDAALGTDISNYLILARTTKQQAIPQGGISAITGMMRNNRPGPVPQGVAIQQGKIAITDVSKLRADSSVKYTTLWDFMDQYIAFSPPGNPGPQSQPVSMVSPFQSGDKEKLRTSLALLFDKCSLDADYEIPARININTAPADVLSALGINQADIEKLLEHRPSPDMDPSTIPYYKTPAWLVTEAELGVDVLKLFSPYITTYSQVYRFQVVGYYELRGPQVRLEVVVDANNGRPRILHWRDLSDLGKGYNFSQGGPTLSP
jgi:type II secretory pathway component PulK